MRWSVDTFNHDVDKEIESLPASLRARLLRLMEMVETFGLEQMHEPHVKHLEGKLWELRAKARDGIARGIYVTASGRRVIILHVFEKKTQKTPMTALVMARRRMAMVKQ
jgi:phage-related protein